ncbi:hypothetical protein HZH68_008967 [Vespula germanica]|uniref:Uncharacterized protein n=1 Tax=Vespula germanica TaxID=30212 RepID=A0A834N6Q0_VESGE|nr:hypothetical protein HZH68_008967 [Vespula germanica]
MGCKVHTRLSPSDFEIENTRMLEAWSTRTYCCQQDGCNSGPSLTSSSNGYVVDVRKPFYTAPGSSAAASFGNATILLPSTKGITTTTITTTSAAATITTTTTTTIIIAAAAAAATTTTTTINRRIVTVCAYDVNVNAMFARFHVSKTSINSRNSNSSSNSSNSNSSSGDSNSNSSNNGSIVNR